MLRILSSPKRLCNGLTRRDLLRVGGWGWRAWRCPSCCSCKSFRPAADGRAAERSFGKAKSIILMHLYGAPSQLEFVDPKTRRAGGDSRRAGVDSVEPARLPRLRVAPEPGEGDGPHDGAALADASVPAAWRGLRADRRARRSTWRWSCARTTRGTGRTSARSWSISTASGASGPPRAQQHRVAVPLQQQARRGSSSGRSLRRVPRQRVRPGLDRLRRHGHQDASPRRCATWFTPATTRTSASTRQVTSACRRRPDSQPEVTLDRLNRRQSLLAQFNSDPARRFPPRPRRGDSRGISSRPWRCSNRASWPKPSTCAANRARPARCTA